MELRVVVSIPGLPPPRPDDDPQTTYGWEPFISWLEDHRRELGPVLAWTGEEADVCVSGDYPDPATAADTAVAAVVDALLATDLGHLRPGAVSVEPIPADELDTA